MSQFEAAHGCGLSLTYYHRLEGGTHNPSLRVLEQVSAYYETPLPLLLA